MQEALSRADDTRLVARLLLALARIGEPPPYEGIEDAPAIAPLLIEHVSDSNREVAETAVIALGVLGTTDSLVRLADLVHDAKPGRKLCGRNRVPTRMRALAAYGMGVAARHLDRYEASRYAVHHLSRVLDAETRKNVDLQVACVIALGMVRLDPAQSPGAGSVSASWPSSGWAAQVDHLLALLEDEDRPRLVRAHVPTALARLLVGAPADVKERVARVLIAGRSPRVEKDADVRRGCVIALGTIGDRDDDEIDAAIRAALVESVQGRDGPARSFAVISLAQVAMRSGGGSEVPPASEQDVMTLLLGQLSRGKSLLRPWAGISLGLVGHARRRDGRPPSKDAEAALSCMLDGTQAPEVTAACAVGAGLAREVRLRRDVEELLLDSGLEAYRGHLAVSLGLMGDPASLPSLRRVMADALHEPLLMEQAAIARALLVDRDLNGELLERLEECECWASTWGVTRALGWTADHRALRPLLDLLRDTRRSEPERGLAAEALGWIADKESLPWDAWISSSLNYTAASETLTASGGLGILDTR